MPKLGTPTALLTALALAIFVAVPALAAGELYRSDGLKFEIAFAVPPQRQAQELNLASGPATVVRLNADDGRLKAALSVVSFSREPFSDAEAQFGLDQARERQLRAVDGELVIERKLTIAGARASELIIAFGPAEENFRYRLRTVYVGSRQFIVSVIGTEADINSPLAEAFFASFKPWL